MILTTVNLKGGLYRTTATLLLAQAYQQLGYDVAVLDLTPTDDCATLAKVLEDSRQAAHRCHRVRCKARRYAA
jgi:cellulose biosynthesis protein BcsQ